MTADIYIRGIVIIFLLALSAIFSGSETAITSVTISQIRKLKEEDEETAELLIRMKKKINEILSTLLIGNNLVNIAATSLVTEMSLRLLKGSNSMLISTVVMTVLVLVFGEITPKSFASQNQIAVAKLVSKPLGLLATLMKPVVFILNKVTAIPIKLLGGEARSEVLVTEDDIRSLVDVGEEEGILRYQEKEMIQNIFEIDDLEAAEVMVPRIDIVALPKETTLREIVESSIDFGFSRIPVYEDSIDNIVGILYVKDLLPLALGKCGENQDMQIAEIMREAYYVPETKKVNVLLKELQIKQIHMAIVLDEYGGTEGLVTIEDILEEIVGEIFDEYDSEIKLIKKIDEGKYIIQADVSLEEINDIFGKHLPEEDFDSFGGYIFSTLGRIPERGDIVRFEDLSMRVLRMENRRVDKVEIRVLKDGEEVLEKNQSEEE